MKVAAHTTTKVHHFFSMTVSLPPRPIAGYRIPAICLFPPWSTVDCVGSITIDVLDRRIIQALYVEPRAPFSRLSEVLGPSEQTIARRYRRLFDGHVVRVVGQLDSQRLGRSDWAVRIRCAPGSAPSGRHQTGAASGHRLGAADLRGNRDLLHDPLPRHGAADPTAAQPALGRPPGRRPRGVLPPPPVRRRGVAPARAELPQPDEIDRLLSPARGRTSIERPTVTLQDADWPLVQALAEDGRASYRQLAARTHWHESTVRRRVEELIASGVLSFDVDLATDALGFHSPALLWMSVVPAKLAHVGQALAGRPEVPFVAATTGSTNLVAALLCQDDRSLYEYITGEMAALDGLTHIETAPVMRAVKMHATVTPPDV